MSQILIAVINGTRARFLTLEKAEVPEYEYGPKLIERKDMLNPTREVAGKDLWSNVKTGRNQSSTGQAHAYDDHRENHMSEFERRFAQIVAAEIVNLIQAYQAQQLVLVSETQTIGVMREALTPLLPKNVQIQEVAKDLCKLKPLEIHDYLANKNLLPARKKVTS